MTLLFVSMKNIHCLSDSRNSDCTFCEPCNRRAA